MHCREGKGGPKALGANFVKTMFSHFAHEMPKASLPKAAGETIPGASPRVSRKKRAAQEGRAGEAGRIFIYCAAGPRYLWSVLAVVLCFVAVRRRGVRAGAATEQAGGRSPFASRATL